MAYGCHGNRPCEGIGHVSFNYPPGEIIEQDCDLLASESEEASALEVTEFQHKQLRVRRVLYIYSE